MRGDFGSSRTVAASSGSSWVEYSSSANCARVLTIVLMGYLVAECLLVFTGSNLKYPSAIHRLLEEQVILNGSLPSTSSLLTVSRR